MEYIVDSNIIIYALNDNEKVKVFNKDGFNNINISFVTFIEKLSYLFPQNNRIKVRNYLNNFKLHYINDNIIASTAITNNLYLVTANIYDFKNLGIEFINPIE